MTGSGEVIHFSVVDQALVRCSKKAGRQTFGQPRKGLYSFGKDYVCSVSPARDSLNVYLENNPRYCAWRKSKYSTNILDVSYYSVNTL